MKTIKHIFPGLFLILLTVALFNPANVASGEGYLSPNPVMSLDFAEKDYFRGDNVTFYVELKNNDLTPLYFHEYTWSLYENERQISKLHNATDEHGKASITFNIPEDLKSTTVLLKVKTEHDGESETISKWIPVRKN